MAMFYTNIYDIGDPHMGSGIIVTPEGRFVYTSTENLIESNIVGEVQRESLSSALKGMEESQNARKAFGQTVNKASVLNKGDIYEPEVAKTNTYKGRGTFAPVAKASGGKCRVMPRGSFKARSKYS